MSQIITRDFGTDGKLHFVSTSTLGFTNDCAISAYFSEARAQEVISDTLNNGGHVQEAQQFGYKLPLDMAYDTALMMVDQRELY